MTFSKLEVHEFEDDINAQNTEEDIYQKYLNQGESAEKQKGYPTSGKKRSNYSLLQTVIQLPHEEDSKELQNAIKVYKEQVIQSRQSRYDNNAPTPTELNIGVTFNTNEYLRTVKTSMKKD